jgi:putative SOS response-associated peptidase YedK
VEKTGHDRMPLIVKRADWQRWLEPGDADRPPVDLLRPFDADQMKAWQADAKINDVRNTGPELGQRISGPGFGQQRLGLG